MAKTTTAAKTGGFTHDVSCNYENIAGIAGDFKGLLASQDPGNHISAAGSGIKGSGEWDGKQQFVEAVRGYGQHITEVIAKLEKLADRMEKAAEIMRQADATVNTNVK